MRFFWVEFFLSAITAWECAACGLFSIHSFFSLYGGCRDATLHPSCTLRGITPNQTKPQKTTMKKTLSTYEIADSLCNDEYANWSHAGAFAMAEHLEELEADCGQEMEFDAVNIRCDFAEHSSLQDWAIDHFGGVPEALEGLGLESETELDELEDGIRAHIKDRGTLIEFDGGIVVSSF